MRYGKIMMGPVIDLLMTTRSKLFDMVFIITFKSDQIVLRSGSYREYTGDI